MYSPSRKRKDAAALFLSSLSILHITTGFFRRHSSRNSEKFCPFSLTSCDNERKGRLQLLSIRIHWSDSKASAHKWISCRTIRNVICYFGAFFSVFRTKKYLSLLYLAPAFLLFSKLVLQLYNTFSYEKSSKVQTEFSIEATEIACLDQEDIFFKKNHS